jgi:hypothetical protein
VERFRGERWAEQPIQTPFAFAILSATPPADIPHSDMFPGSHRKQALDHPLLHQRMRASKPAELVIVNGKNTAAADPLVRESDIRTKNYERTTTPMHQTFGSCDCSHWAS